MFELQHIFDQNYKKTTNLKTTYLSSKLKMSSKLKRFIKKIVYPMARKLFEDHITKNNLEQIIFEQVQDNEELKLKLLRTLPRELNVVLGASAIAMPGWIPTEMEFLDVTKESDWQALFLPNSIDRILAEHVWEHLTEDTGIVAAKNCYKYLKQTGHIRIAVPDGFHPSPDYIEYVKCGGTGVGSDDHKALYTYRSLSRVFELAGFKVRLLEYWDEHKQFHFIPWDVQDGFVERSKEHDERNKAKELSYTSIILDGIKDG